MTLNMLAECTPTPVVAIARRMHISLPVVQSHTELHVGPTRVRNYKGMITTLMTLYLSQDQTRASQYNARRIRISRCQSSQVGGITCESIVLTLSFVEKRGSRRVMVSFNHVGLVRCAGDRWLLVASINITSISC